MRFFNFLLLLAILGCTNAGSENKGNSNSKPSAQEMPATENLATNKNPPKQSSELQESKDAAITIQQAREELQERIDRFVDAVIDFLEPIPITAKTGRFINQLTGSAGSVGANYRASRRARSHAEFAAKIGVVSEEADESEYWLARAVRHRYGDTGTATRLHEEALELTKILGRSAGTARRNEAWRPLRKRRGPQFAPPDPDSPLDQ